MRALAVDVDARFNEIDLSYNKLSVRVDKFEALILDIQNRISNINVAPSGGADASAQALALAKA